MYTFQQTQADCKHTPQKYSKITSCFACQEKNRLASCHNLAIYSIVKKKCNYIQGEHAYSAGILNSINAQTSLHQFVATLERKKDK